ncbi:unnamed protein product [Brassica oleracea var. botrytis]|uniref:(rape) hypothetical protein n=1 Tax=Brassica napus TaxID=3708 RepID=A0A816L6X6_BRANA|nr:unnamed protein product [Brassica napus]
MTKSQLNSSSVCNQCQVASSPTLTFFFYVIVGGGLHPLSKRIR